MGERREYATFLKRESHKHKYAKDVLRLWLEEDGFEVKDEVELEVEGWRFFPDLVVYKDGHIQAFYEVVHTHPVDWRKLSRIQHYCWHNKLDLLLHEVDAEWIMRQLAGEERPPKLVMFTFDLNMNKYTEEYNREEILAETLTQ